MATTGRHLTTLAQSATMPVLCVLDQHSLSATAASPTILLAPQSIIIFSSPQLIVLRHVPMDSTQLMTQIHVSPAT